MNRSRTISKENKLTEESKPNFRHNTTAQRILGNVAAPSSSESARKDLQEFKDEEKTDLKFAALKRNYDGLSRLVLEQKNKEKTFEQQITDLNKENTHYKLRIQNLEKQSSQFKEALDKTLLEKAALQKSMEEYKNFESEKKLLNSNFDKLRKDHKEVSTNYESARKELEFVRRWKIEVENELKRYRQDLDDMSKEFKKNLQHTQILETVKASLEKKIAEDVESKEFLMNRIKKYEEKETEFKNKWENITAQLNKERLDNTNLQNRCAGLIQELDKLTRENDSRYNLMKLSSSNESEMKEKIKNLTLELTTKNQQLEMVQIQNTKLSSDLAKTTQKNDGMKDLQYLLDNELKSLNARISNLTEDLQVLRSQNEQNEKVISDRDKRISHLETLITSQNAEIDSLSKALQNSSQSSEGKYQEVIGLLESYKQQVNLLKADLQKEKQKSNGMLNDFKELETSRKGTETLRNEIETLKRSFEKERWDMNKQLKESRSYSDKLKADYESISRSYEEFKTELSTHSDTSSKLLSENLKLTKQLNDSQTELSDIRSQYETLNTNLRKANELLGSSSGREEIIKSLRNTISILETKLESFQSELNRNRENEKLLYEKAQQFTALESQYDIKCQEVSSLRKSNTDQVSSIQKMKNDLESLSSKLARLQSSYDLAQDSNIEFQNQIKKLQDEIQQIKRAKNDELEKKLADKSKTISEGIEKISKAIESIENNLHCMNCFDTLDSAIVCVPCGHWYCMKCTRGYESECSQCSMAVEQTVKVVLVDEMVSKLSYSKETLGHIRSIFRN